MGKKNASIAKHNVHTWNAIIEMTYGIDSSRLLYMYMICDYDPLVVTILLSYKRITYLLIRLATNVVDTVKIKILLPQFKMKYKVMITFSRFPAFFAEIDFYSLSGFYKNYIPNLMSLENYH